MQNELKHISEDVYIEVYGVQVFYDIDKGFYLWTEKDPLVTFGTLNEVYNWFNTHVLNEVE